MAQSIESKLLERIVPVPKCNTALIVAVLAIVGLSASTFQNPYLVHLGIPLWFVAAHVAQALEKRFAR